MSCSIRRLAARLLCSAAWLIASGCAQFQPEPLSPAALAGGFQARTLDDVALRRSVGEQTGRPAPPWDLAGLQAAAVYWNPRLRALRADAQAARAATAASAQRPLASLSAPLEYTTNPRAGESPYTAGVGLDVTIETGDKREHRARQAAQLASAAAFDVEAERWRVGARLREALLEFWSRQSEAAESGCEAAARDEIVRLVEHRVRLGAAASPDVFLARSQAQQAQQRALAAGRLAHEAIVTAAGVIGLPAAALESAPLQLGAFGVLPAAPPSQADPVVASRRADVSAALARYDAAQSALQLAVAAQYPDIRLGPGYTFDAGAHKVVLSLVELPLTIARDHRPAIAAAVARRQSAGARLQRTVLEAMQAMDQALVAMREARRAFEAARSQVGVHERLLRAAEGAFAAGDIDRVALLRSQADAAAARAQRQAALLDVQQAAGAIELAWQRPPAASKEPAP